MILAPWLIHDAEVALWPAWKDGMPFRGPGEGRDRPGPLLHCKSSLGITETFTPSAATGHGWTAAEMPASSTFEITIEFADGAVADEWGRLMSRVHPGGFRILTVRFLDESSGIWSMLAFYYVVPATDAGGQSGQQNTRTLTLRSSWLQESAGDTGLPAMEPVPRGQIDWICGTQRITAMEYDPFSETWTSLPRNETGDGSRYVTLTPVSEDAESDVILAAYLPRVEPAPVSGTLLPAARVRWQNTVALQVGNHNSASHHGLTLSAGHTLQQAGIAEPLVTLPQARVLDEPVIVFRYMRRIYATLGHGVLAVPRLTVNEPPPVTHDPAFRIAATGPANPATGHSGLVILPNGAWLDGTLLTIP